MTKTETVIVVLIMGMFTILYIALKDGAPYRSTLGDKINEGICHRMHGVYSVETGHCTKGETHETK